MNYWVIKAIGENVISANASANRRNFPIRIDEPAPARVIIPALEIIQPGLGVVDITAISSFS